MKRILRAFVIEAGVLFIVSQIATGLLFEEGAIGLLIAAGALTAANFVVKPVVNALLLPLNLLTFGLFRWVSYAITLYLVDLVIPQLTVNGFGFGGFSSTFFSIPGFSLGSGVLSYLAFSFLISLLASFVYWLLD